MKIIDILNELDQPIQLPKFDTENYGKWKVEMSKSPIKMPAITGNKEQVVAKVSSQDRKGQVYYGTGSSQAAARDEALNKAIGVARPESIDKYKHIDVDFNGSFSQQYQNKNSTNWFKFIKDNGQLFLVRANINYVKEFGDEIKELGFSRAVPRTNTEEEYLGGHINKSVAKAIDLQIFTRYTLEYSGNDADDNELFIMHPASRVQHKGHVERLGVPAVTIVGTDPV